MENRDYFVEECIVPECPGKNCAKILLFRIPENDIAGWCRNLRIPVSEIDYSERVCSRHFEPLFILSRGLKTGARPTLKLGHIEDAVPAKAPRLSEYLSETVDTQMYADDPSGSGCGPNCCETFYKNKYYQEKALLVKLARVQHEEKLCLEKKIKDLKAQIALLRQQENF